jgi:hypothetical protein
MKMYVSSRFRDVFFAALDVAVERFRFAALHVCYRSPPSACSGMSVLCFRAVTPHFSIFSASSVSLLPSFTRKGEGPSPKYVLLAIGLNALTCFFFLLLTPLSE